MDAPSFGIAVEGCLRGFTFDRRGALKNLGGNSANILFEGGINSFRGQTLFTTKTESGISLTLKTNNSRNKKTAILHEQRKNKNHRQHHGGSVGWTVVLDLSLTFSLFFRPIFNFMIAIVVVVVCLLLVARCCFSSPEERRNTSI